MHSLFSLVLVAVMAAPSLGQLSLSCFNTDLTFDCSTFIPSFCNSVGNSTPAQIVQSDTITRCFNVAASGGRCKLGFAHRDFANDGARPQAISLRRICCPTLAFQMSNCGAALTPVAEVCPSGGSGQFSGLNFRFWMDPNTGGCPIPGF
ncbi:hypothetical protein FB451DRAFT_1168068 [Mycena latifolia]|nr:hypothetical protein FB451DRAFT_1168068 [Mycena latifolia]